MYIATREGIYGHGIVACHDNLEECIKLTVQVARLEPDDWHTFDIHDCLSGWILLDVNEDHAPNIVANVCRRYPEGEAQKPNNFFIEVSVIGEERVRVC